MMGNVGRVTASKNEEFAPERRDTILNGVCAQSRLDQAKIDQITAATDLSQASLNSHFPSKDSPLHSLIERYAMLPELPEMMAALEDTPPALGMPTLIAEIWHLLQERKELARAISREIRCSTERGRIAEQIGLSSYQSLADYVDRWMNCGVLVRQNSLAVARCVIGMLWFFLLTQELIGGKGLYPLSDQTVVTAVARMFLGGAAKSMKHSPSHTSAGGDRHQGS